MINGQVAVMWLLSALFLLPQKDNNGLLANFTSCYHLHITISSNPGRGKKRSVKR